MESKQVVAPLRTAPKFRAGRFFSNMMFFSIGFGATLYFSDQLTVGHIKEVYSIKKAV